MSETSRSFNERGTRAIIDLVMEWNRGDLGPDKAISFVADVLTDTFGSSVLDDPHLTVPDSNGNAIVAGAIVIVPHPAGAFRGKVVRVDPPVGDGAGHLTAGSCIVEAAGYIRGDGRLGFLASQLTLVEDNGLSPVLDWAVPDPAADGAAKLRAELQAYFDANDLWYDARWYTQAEWAARGEPYGNEALLSITFEGPIYGEINDGDGKVEVFIQEAAGKYGLFMEQGYAWSGHFYPR